MTGVAGVLRLLNPVGYARAFVSGGMLLLQHWRLVLVLVRRELAQRHKGQIIGTAWLIGHPLFLTALYVFVFTVVFQVRIGGTHDLPLDYATYILAGLVPWMTFQQAMTASTTSITSNAQLVKQFVFKIELLPTKDVVMALVFWIVCMPTLLIYIAVKHGVVGWILILLPVALLLQLLAMIGVAFALSAATVFVRDMRDVVTLFSTAGMFLVPIAYLPGWIPPVFRPLVYANPFSYMTWVYQDIVYFGRFEHPEAWVAYFGLSIAAFGGGYRLFQRLKPFFGSAL